MMALGTIIRRLKGLANGPSPKAPPILGALCGAGSRGLIFARMSCWRMVAFQPRKPMHRAHMELPLRTLGEQEARLLVHPVGEMAKPGDIEYYTRVRCYQAIPVHRIFWGDQIGMSGAR